jgi:hypothetical protein
MATQIHETHETLAVKAQAQNSERQAHLCALALRLQRISFMAWRFVDFVA